MYSMSEFVLNPAIAPDAADCMCKLAELTQLALSSAFVQSDITKLDTVVREYLCLFCRVCWVAHGLHGASRNLTFILLQVYGYDMTKPNDHFIIHLAEDIRRFGPVYVTWCMAEESALRPIKGLIACGRGIVFECLLNHG